MVRAWVVIPMYNEATVIGGVIAEVRQHFEHVVCVDDGSSDDSAEQALAAGAVVVRHPVNLGQGASLQTGFDFALSDPLTTEVVTFDADGQHQVEDAVGMLAKLRAEGLDVVIGSRFLDSRTELPGLKKVILPLARAYTRLTTGMRLTDAHNGMRVFDSRFLGKIRIRQNRMAHASELVDQISSLHAKWGEYPTRILYSEYSRAKGQSVLNSVNILVDLFFR
jgi:glycosyltransferase involved in cell wall biosynthesis